MTIAPSVAFFRHPHPAPLAAEARAGLMADPGFGRVFTDHMVTIRYADAAGWHDARVGARGPITLDPAAAVLHYAQEIFEGLKAYRAPGGDVLLFRPEVNARRFQTSAARLAMPALPESLFLGAVEAMVEADRDWIPERPGSLYLRPFMFATEAFLGVKPASEYLFVVIASAVGDYFKGGQKAVTLWASRDYVRAAPGGAGDAKCGGNYAASLLAQSEAIRQGCDQVIFLDAVERRWIEELGGMNIFFVFDDGSLVTPPLGGTILPGVTRDAVITLARARGHRVREAPYAFEDWRSDAASGHLVETFACGTAATLTAIGQVRDGDGGFTIGDGEPGPITRGLLADLQGIQTGLTADRFGWTRRIR